VVIEANQARSCPRAVLRERHPKSVLDLLLVGLAQAIGGSMTKWISAAMLAVAAILGAAATPTSAATAPAQAATQERQKTATGPSARHRYYHHDHYAYRPYYPYYYGRPYYYSPGPILFLPVPPSWGNGWEWW